MILLASEGINSTIAGPPEGVHAVLAWLRQDPRLADLQHKEAWSDKAPFYRMKVRLKREIVTLGVPGANPSSWRAPMSSRRLERLDFGPGRGGGGHPQPLRGGHWHFHRRAQPAHRQLFTIAAMGAKQTAALNPATGKKPKVAMFCTGGIRCEKSTALLRAQGFDEVYHLEGGILKYLETVPPEQSLWQGQCFVFDERVSVGHGLEMGDYGLCRACRMPISEADKLSPLFEDGVSCAAAMPLPVRRKNRVPVNANANGTWPRRAGWIGLERPNRLSGSVLVSPLPLRHACPPGAGGQRPNL